jgi:hypothetical protein
MLDSETTQKTPALLGCRIFGDGAPCQAARCGARLRRRIACDGRLDWAMPYRQEGPGSSTCRDFVYLDLMPGVRLIDAQRAGTRDRAALDAAPFVSQAHHLLDKLLCVCGRTGVVLLLQQTWDEGIDTSSCVGVIQWLLRCR